MDALKACVNQGIITSPLIQDERRVPLKGLYHAQPSIINYIINQLASLSSQTSTR